jgi:ABC-type transport system substrate-binding protein
MRRPIDEGIPLATGSRPHLASLRSARLIVCLFLVGACRKPASGPAPAPGPVIVACGPTGCPSDGVSIQPHSGGALRVHVEAEPATLCDLVEHDVWSRWIMENQVSETLFFQDPWTGAVSGRLAERWEATPAALTLHLRPNVKWRRLHRRRRDLHPGARPRSRAGRRSKERSRPGLQV